MSLATSAIFQGADQNILDGGTITADVTPSPTYTVATLGYLRPDWRLKFGTGTVTITWTLTAPALGDILCIPMFNVVDTHVGLTNGSGLSVSIAVPGTLRNGVPKTIVVDLSILDTNAAHRTSDVWHLVISDNPDDVTLGCAIAIYGPKTSLGDRDFQWAYTIRKRGAYTEIYNEYRSRFGQNMLTMERSIDLSTLATDADAEALEGWFDGCNGRGAPGLLWLTPEVEDAFFGIWQDTFERVRGSAQVEDTELIKLRFDELSKGLPLL